MSRPIVADAHTLLASGQARNGVQPSWGRRGWRVVIVEGGAMNDDFCLFVILTSLVALLLPPSGALIYLVFAGVLVSLAGVAGGIGRGEFPARPTATSPHDL